MTYDAKETSRHEGSPVEMYEFSLGATRWRWTSSDVQQLVGTETFEPAVITRSEIAQSQEDHAGNIEVRLPRDNALAALYVPYIPSTPVGLIIHRRHRLDLDEETVVAFVGEVLSIRFDSDTSEAILTCGPITQALRKTIPIVLFQFQCNHALYSPGCGVDKEAFKVTATVDAIAGDTISASEFSSTSFEDGHFNNGWVQRQSDPTDMRWIINHVGDTITLMNPFQDLAVNDVIEAFPGCMRTEADCLQRYNNLPNHLGFSRIPYRNPFDGSIEY